MKKLLPVVVASVLTSVLIGCGGGISGDYGGNNCIYEKLSFKDDGVAYVTFMGTEAPAQYKVDGDKIAVTAANGQGIVFTKNGDTLEAGLMGEKMECKKL